MTNDFNMPVTPHRLELMDRAHLTVSGVEDVERFDESGVIMTTSAGTLIVTGEDLHIGKLSLEGGKAVQRWAAGGGKKGAWTSGEDVV